MLDYGKLVEKNMLINLQLEDVVEKAALLAGAKLASLSPKTLEKPRKDFLTDADIASEEVIIEHLQKHYPQIGVFSEEQGGKHDTDKPLWIIDPIDGSANYFFGDDRYWNISIALVEKRKTVFGLVYSPARRTYWKTFHQFAISSHTGGIWKGISVSHRSNLAECQVWTDWIKGDDKKVLRILGALKKHTLYPQIRLCATACLIDVAAGRIDGYVHPQPEPFDIAAGCLIVEKAGGTVTDLQGNPWSPFSKSIVATNGKIHNQVLEIVGQ